MNEGKQSRRQSLVALGGLTTIPLMLQLNICAQEANGTTHIATNTYPWSTFARRDDEQLTLHTDQLLQQISSTGITGYEPIVEAAKELKGLGPRLSSHGLEMRSIYVNSVLHEPNKADNSIANVVAIAKSCQPLGTRIIVTNPSPIRWGGDEDKSDSQLRFQAKALNRLGAELRNLGIALAYHNHDAELRQGGREFHHMLTATDPQNVKFCFDAHWVYRGCGNSEVAVFDVLEHYCDRIVELHLRQSQGGVWSETFTMQGDIDYRPLLNYLTDREISPHLVLEQAVEAASPNQLSVVEAHRSSRDNLARKG